VVWVVISYNDVVGHQRFEGTCCLHLQSEETSQPRRTQLQSSWP